MSPAPDTVSATDLACDVRVVDLSAVAAGRAALAREAASLQALSALFAAFADPTRLRLLVALARASLCTCDLAATLGVTESAISHQLRILKDLDLVRSRREGKMMYHELADAHVERLITLAAEHVAEREG